jgi:alpha-glucoside transport system substrate-binding protein
MLRKRFATLAIFVIVSMLLVACGPEAAAPTATTGAGTQATATTAGTGDTATATTGATGDTATATTGAEADGTPTEAADADGTPTTGTAGGDRPHAGKKVTIFGVAADEQARLFQAEFEPFEERTGIDVVYEGNKDFETLILVRVEGNNAPDIAQFAQPGLLADFVRKGNVVDLNTFMDRAQLEEQYNPTFLDLATVDGKMAGLWHNNDVKSLVWYPKKAFDAAGYTVPETWDELIALSDKMVADGSAPWCIGIESAGATGWVGTDWVEDVVLRTTTPENYDRWVNGELDFNSPEIKAAFDRVGEIWFKEGYVYGGTPTILTTAFGDAVDPLFENPPKCWLHRQASFITNFFPETAKVGEDIDYFYLPPIDPAQGKPVLGSGSISAMFNDRPEVREVMEFLATGESMKVEAEAGVGVAPHKDADPSWYPNDATRGFAEILQNATTFRFDASDLMPSAVGAGSFWTGIVDWVGAEGANTEEVLQNIDASWPTE